MIGRRWAVRRFCVRHGVALAAFGAAALAAAASLAADAGSRPAGFTGAVTGIGGVFLRAEDPERLLAWYSDHLGIERAEGHQGVNFFWRDRSDPERFGRTIWSVFPRDSDYFGDRRQAVMINYRVGDLDRLLRTLRARGVQQVGRVEEYPYGRFAWIVDIEGNRVELWEPAARDGPD